jgi:hypothetical protein
MNGLISAYSRFAKQKEESLPASLYARCDPTQVHNASDNPTFIRKLRLKFKKCMEE